VKVFPRLVHSAPSAEALGERSDDELMQLAQGGSRAAFAKLVERHARRIVALCSRFVADGHIGQELAQDSWVAVWQHKDKYQPSGEFVPWLVTIARNRCRNYLRHNTPALRSVGPAAEIEADASASQIERVLVAERRHSVRTALAQLSPTLREALLLRYGEELRYDEMTVVLGAGESTLRSRVHHGLKSLKENLEKTP
jgi:RNA polymerase sigma-70 factor, ECF subfamily